MPSGKTYVKIASQTLTSNSATVTFSNLPQNFTDLVVVIEGTLTASGVKRINLNGSSSDQSCTTITGDGSSVASGRYSITYLDVANAGTNRFNTIVNIMNYSSGSTFKTYLSRHNAASVSSEAIIGMWRSTSPITSLVFALATGAGAVYSSGCTFTIYGIECAKNPYATGGDKIYTTGTHWVHEFYNSGLFVPRQNLTADYLVVAGGGSGGGLQEWGGGGGAGGLRSTVTATGGGGSLESALSLNSGIGYTVTVGAGGAGKTVRGSGNQGSNSTFSTITATGGGGGGGINAARTGIESPSTGGSGGGGEANATYFGGSSAGAAGTANQGFAGGNGWNTTPVYNYSRAGGGGGAGAAGQNGEQGTGSSSPASPAGNGGNGVAVSITGSSVTYAGGGGGGSYFSTALATGGTGGGGAAGNSSTNGTAGTANTGGGGGGNGSTLTGQGGSGIVIVRYPV